VAGGGIGQVHPAVALLAAAAVQIRPGQSHSSVVIAVQANGQGPGLGVEGGNGATAAIGHPQLTDRVLATHDPITDGQLAVLDQEPPAAEPAASGEELLAGGVEPVDLGPPGG
jgi:hypothetical protein